MRHAHTTCGQRVLVNGGAGGVGSYAVQLARALAPSGGVEDCLDEQAGVAVQAGDGVAKADGWLVSEAGREAGHSALSAGPAVL